MLHTFSARRFELSKVLREELVFGGGVGAARAVALVGPTGVGKTTTIAKIAAHEQLAPGRNVGLVTIDEYCVGGIEQLGRYAEPIGCCGSILAAHVQSGLPLDYFTNGQRVPEDGSVAMAAGLAAQLRGEDVN